MLPRSLLLIILLLFGALAGRSQVRELYLDSDEDNQLRKISFYSPTKGFIAFDEWVGFTTDSGRTFIKKYITDQNVDYNGYPGVNITFGFGIEGVKAFNQDTIIVYGDYGLVPAILFSKDGGDHFKLVYHSQYDPNALRTGVLDMVFPQNNQIGFAVDADRILKTVDRGLSWTVNLVSSADYLTYLEAIDNNNVFAFSNRNKRFWKTNNAGTSWQHITIPSGNIRYASFITPNIGWLNTDDGRVHFTSNGGTSWVRKNNTVSFVCRKFKFVNDSTGYAIGDAFISYKTTDSGRIWEKLQRDNDFTYLGYSHDDLFYMPSQFWLGGGHGFLETSTNGGGTPIPLAVFTIDTTGLYIANNVKLINYSKPNYQYKWFLNDSLISTSYNANYTHDIYRGADTVKLVVLNGALSDTSVRTQNFNAVPYPAPVINSFSPTSGGTGTTVTITGDFFNNASVVKFGDVPASSFIVNSLTQITAVVGAGENGAVSVTTPSGTGVRAGYVFAPSPTISSFSPLSGPIGTTVTINGSNFDPTASNNKVFFGGVKANVITATSNSLTVTVPTGTPAEPITVTVNSHTTISNLFFTVTFPSTCGVNDYTFAPPISAKISTPFSHFTGDLAIADLDGDGKPDFAVNYDSGLFVIRNRSTVGNLKFDSSIKYATGYGGLGVAIQDLNGDGKPDIVVSNYNGFQGGKISILRNTSTVGSISFAPKIDLSAPDRPASIAIGDLDGDGRPEIVVGNSEGNASFFSVFKNIGFSGQIAFAPKIDIPTGRKTHRIKIADIDGDSKPDVITAYEQIVNSVFALFSVHRNTSSLGIISFAPQFNLIYNGNYPGDMALSDINSDSKVDIIVQLNDPYQNLSPFVVATNNSSPGIISFTTTLFSSCGTISLPHGDLDGDGRDDFLVGACAMRNTSSAASTSLQMYYLLSGGSSNSSGINDIDGDGKPESINASTADAYAYALWIHRNIIDERGGIAGKDTSICTGRSVMLGYFNYPLSRPGYTYSWSSNPAGFTSSIASPLVNPSVTTTYYLALTTQQGCTDYDTVTVTVGGPPPIIDAGPFRIVCLPDSTQLGSPAIAGNTYSWTSNPAGFVSSVADPVVRPTTHTSYILSVSNANCMLKDTVNVDVYSRPPANAGPDRLICLGNTAAIGTSGVSNTTYSWTSNPPGFTSSSSTTVVSPIVTTSYFLTATRNTCSARDTVVVTLTAAPIVDAGPDKSICQGASTTIGTASIAGQNYSWTSSPAGFSSTIANPTVSPAVSTTYYLRVSNSACTRMDTVVVNVGPTSPPTITINTSNTSICAGQSVTFTSVVANGGSTPVYQWKVNGNNVGTNSSTFATSTLNNGDVVSATISVTGSCANPTIASSNTIIMVVNTSAVPTISLSGVTTLPQGQFSTIASATTNAGTNPTYQWQDSTGTHNWQNLVGTVPSHLLYYFPNATGDKVRCILTSSLQCANPKTVQSAALTFTVNTVTSVPNIPASEYGIRVYPQPVRSVLTIDSLKTTMGWQTLEIIGTSGERGLLTFDIPNRVRVDLHVDKLSPGVYIALLRRRVGPPVYIKFIKL